MAKCKFKKGDKVRRIKSTSSTGNNVKIGGTDEVVFVPGMREYDNMHFANTEEGFTLKKDGWEYQEDWELVKRRKWKQKSMKQNKPKFKVGDKVRLINDKNMDANIGEIAAITGLGKLESKGWIEISWDNHISQQDGQYTATNFELLTKKTMKKFKVGDKVKLIKEGNYTNGLEKGGIYTVASVGYGIKIKEQEIDYWINKDYFEKYSSDDKPKLIEALVKCDFISKDCKMTEKGKTALKYILEKLKTK